MSTPAQPLPSAPKPIWLTPASLRRRILYDPNRDPTHLSTPVCILRAQIEAFPATSHDIAERISRGGMKKNSLEVGRVGLRCVHCMHVPLCHRTKGAVSYPISLRTVHQGVRNYQRYHFMTCPFMPDGVREEFSKWGGKKKSQSRKDSSEYWIECCRGMGMRDDEDGDDGDGDDGGGADGGKGGGGGGGGEGIRFDAGDATAAAEDEDEDDEDGDRRIGSGAVGPAAGDARSAADRPAGAAAAAAAAAAAEAGSSDDGGGAFGSAARSAEAVPSGGVGVDATDAELELELELFPSAATAPPADGAGLLFSPSEILEPEPEEEGQGKEQNQQQRQRQQLAFAAAGVEAQQQRRQQQPSLDAELFSSAMLEQRRRRPQHPTAESNGGSGAIESARRNQSLDLVRIAIGIAGTARARHGRSGANGGGSKDGFGGPAPQRRQLLPPSEGRVRADLVALGSDLYRHFAGTDAFERGVTNGTGIGSVGGAADATSIDIDGTVSSSSSTVGIGGRDGAEQQPTSKREKRRASSSRSYVPLREHGLPVSLCALVSSLLDAATTEDGYQTPSQVEDDLRLMCAEPERYLFDCAHRKGDTGRLEFPPGTLYGRHHQIAEVVHSFGRILDASSSSGEGGGGRRRGSSSPRELVLISGYSGTGKSVLIEQLREPLRVRNGNFISVKFEESGQVQPMAIIFGAFDDYCRDLLLGGDDGESLSSTRSDVRAAMGHHVNVLTDLIPNLSLVMGESSVSSLPPPPLVEGVEALNRFLFYFRVFVRAIAAPSHPVVLFLDDLQWADRASLELISTLVSDTETSSLLFAGCYRSNEVGAGHALTAEIGKIASSGVNVRNIVLQNIDRESVNDLLSDTLHLLPRLTKPLAAIVHAKTGGNPLFVVQFLRSLCDENLLSYLATSRRWEWDVQAIRAKDVADNVVDLMTKKMLALDARVQWLLKVAACLGSRSEASVLKLLCSNGEEDGSGIMQFFDLAVNEGLMSSTGSCYKFSHDQIQQAAYSLISEGERDALHLHIGRILWKKTAAKHELDDIVFIVVDQLHRGSNLISDNAEKVEVARLCLMAGKKAMASYAFLQTSICLLQGSTLLEESDWESNYDLSLELFTCCAEAQYACGNLDAATIMLDPIWKFGRRLQDKLRAYYTLLNSLGAQGRQLDAIKAGLGVLAQLGEPYPSEPNKNDVMDGFGKTQAMLQRTDTGEILKTDQMRDVTKIAALKLQNILTRYACQTNQDLMALLTFRTVQLSLCYGVCPESALAFAVLGAMLNAFGDFESGHQYGKLALSLLERFENKEYLPHVSAVVYDAVVIFKMPLQAGLPSIKHAYELGLSLGDVEWAMTNANIYSVFALQCGSKLEPLAGEVRAYVQQMKEYQHHMLALTQPCLQAILNLMGGGQDPSNLTGEAMNQDELLSISQETQQYHVICLVYIMRMWLAYLFGRYDVAAEMVEGCRSIPRISPGGTMISETFYTGLIAAVMALGDASGEWRTIAQESLEKIKVWAQQSSWNFQHKVDLLRAEIAYNMEGDLEGAAKAYDDAIQGAGEHGFVHEQALACERAGMFHSKTSGTVIAAEYFEKAKTHYLEWGATQKVEDLVQWRDP